MGLDFRPADLHPRDQIVFLKRAAPERCELLCGIVAHRARKKDAAMAQFRKDDGTLAQLLLAEAAK
jgi:hypothetical protein